MEKEYLGPRGGKAFLNEALGKLELLNGQIALSFMCEHEAKNSVIRITPHLSGFKKRRGIQSQDSFKKTPERPHTGKTQ